MKKDPEEPWESSKVYYWQGIGGVVIVQQRCDATLLFTITCKIRRKTTCFREAVQGGVKTMKGMLKTKIG